MSKVQFFGYGANRNREKIKQIIGRDPGLGIGVILNGYTLNLQLLSQIPNPPQNFLKELYGSSFKSYTLKKQEGIVVGILYELEDKELAFLKEWEFIGQWREIINVKVTTTENFTIDAVTEKSSDKFSTFEQIDGLLYDEFKFIRIENKSEVIDNNYYTQTQIEQIKIWLSNQNKK